MESDEQTEQARQRALHLAAEVAETDDSNVPVLLLQLKGALMNNMLQLQFDVWHLTSLICTPLPRTIQD